MSVAHNKTEQHLTEKLSTSGFRFTPQRQQVYDVILHKRDHPTAEEVFIRAKKQMPEISHATVYNCLDALVKSGLVRQVQLQRGAARFCPNMEEHCHYSCDACGKVFDVPYQKASTAMPGPKGFEVDHFDIAAHGLCADCAGRRKN
ncbi:MAG: Fur family transcriptional regulator [Verrucomicrobiota bacterium]|jgi:Fur family peroxide stress response transcriptional regulator